MCIGSPLEYISKYRLKTSRRDANVSIPWCFLDAPRLWTWLYDCISGVTDSIAFFTILPSFFKLQNVPSFGNLTIAFSFFAQNYSVNSQVGLDALGCQQPLPTLLWIICTRPEPPTIGRLKPGTNGVSLRNWFDRHKKPNKWMLLMIFSRDSFT